MSLSPGLYLYSVVRLPQRGPTLNRNHMHSWHILLDYAEEVPLDDHLSSKELESSYLKAKDFACVRSCLSCDTFLQAAPNRWDSAADTRVSVAAERIADIDALIANVQLSATP